MGATTVFNRLRSGVPKGERRPAFDAVSLPAYSAFGVLIAATALLTLALGFSIDPSIFTYAMWAGWLWGGGILMKRVGHDRIGGAAELIGFIYLISFPFFIAIAEVTSLARPDADATLVAMDHALGFDWQTLALALKPHQNLLVVLTGTYRSIVWQPAVVVALLFWSGRSARAWVFAMAWTLSLTAATLIHPFFPAVGPMQHFGFTAAQFPGLLSDGPWRFAPVIHALRDEGARAISAQMMTGLISFPSFHVAAAISMGWAISPVRYVRWPLIILNVAMGSAAVICGPHYLVDIIAGALVAVAAIALSRPLIIRGVGKPLQEP